MVDMNKDKSKFMHKVMAAFILCGAINAQAQVYEVFIAQGEVTPQANTTVYHLAQGDALLKTINLSLGANGVTDEQTAAGYVTQSLQDALMAQMTGLTKAARYQIKYLPAIVKDQTYVVYGSTDPQVFSDFGH